MTLQAAIEYVCTFCDFENGTDKRVMEATEILRQYSDKLDNVIDRQEAIAALKKDIMGGLNYQRILTDLPSMGNSEAKELLPCPFCGSKYVQVRYISNPFDKNKIYGGYRAECPDCCALTRPRDTRQEAVADWNERK